MKLKPQYRSKMILKGYSRDELNQESMGMLYDLNRAFIGFSSPMKEQWKMNTMTKEQFQMEER